MIGRRYYSLIFLPTLVPLIYSQRTPTETCLLHLGEYAVFDLVDT